MHQYKTLDEYLLEDPIKINYCHKEHNNSKKIFRANMKKISLLPNLEDLDIVANLSKIPWQDAYLYQKELSNLHNLKKLTISCNLNYISDELCNIKSLEVLNLYGNNISKISNNINKLVNLKEIYLDNNNNLESLPDNFYELSNLKIISLPKSLKIVLDKFNGLQNLEIINFNTNENIINLPESFYNLTKIKAIQGLTFNFNIDIKITKFQYNYLTIPHIYYKPYIIMNEGENAVVFHGYNYFDKSIQYENMANELDKNIVNLNCIPCVYMNYIPCVYMNYIFFEFDFKEYTKLVSIIAPIVNADKLPENIERLVVNSVTQHCNFINLPNKLKILEINELNCDLINLPPSLELIKINNPTKFKIDKPFCCDLFISQVKCF
jgi:hypothetical protein